jgi:hypothetical protein
MPVIHIDGIDQPLFLIPFDAAGNEQSDPDSGQMLSQQVLDQLADGSTTDVFFFSHGWLDDLNSATDRYTAWMEAMANCTDDIASIKAARPGFKPLPIGIHWPSMPFAKDELAGLGGSGGSFSLPDLGSLVESYASRLVDTATSAVDDAKDAISTIVNSAAQALSPPNLPQPVVDAYNKLNQLAALAASGSASAVPNADRLSFNPEKFYQNALNAVLNLPSDISSDLTALGEGDAILGGVLAPLRMLSFWKMKDRALRIGEGAGFNLLSALQGATGNNVRFHLMGHSFGTIVVSAILADNLGHSPPARKVHSLYLVQGAVSLWSCAASIPFTTIPPNSPGFFNTTITEGTVDGVILTTQSSRDLAVRIWYPLASGVAGQGPGFLQGLPEYGGLGRFGIQGLTPAAEAISMLSTDQSYNFEAGKIYNIESTSFIHKMSGLSGAHSDVAEPEVAHAFWQAASL